MAELLDQRPLPRSKSHFGFNVSAAPRRDGSLSCISLLRLTNSLFIARNSLFHHLGNSRVKSLKIAGDALLDARDSSPELRNSL
jgi:hypothetical protein